MGIINARSPYIVSIEEYGSSQTEIYLYLWNGTGSAPAYPTYVLSKNVPTPTNFLTEYNISPYITEFIDHAIRQNIYPSYPINTPTSQWCNVRVKRYADGVLLDTDNNFGMIGYGSYGQGYNPNNGVYFLDQTTYYYPYNITENPAVNQLRQVGQLSLYAMNGGTYRYTNLNTLAVSNNTFTITTQKFKDIPCVIAANIADGNKLEILDGSTVLATYIFKPQIECYYNPVTIDFVNKYGAWQRTFMFKASYQSLEATNTEYNLMQKDLSSYDVLEGQRKIFNTNGIDKIKTNSGWVNADFSNVLKQIILSERILVNGSPVICLTKSLDVQDSLNINLINYQMEFKFAYDTINSVV